MSDCDKIIKKRTEGKTSIHWSLCGMGRIRPALIAMPHMPDIMRRRGQPLPLYQSTSTNIFVDARVEYIDDEKLKV